MTRSVTVKDIAQMAEVSIATVSRALNNHQNINAEVRQRVLQVAAELGYFKATTRHASSKQKELQIKKICFLLCYNEFNQRQALSDPFWAGVLHGAETEARKYNLQLVYQAINYQTPPYSLQAQIHEMEVDGILLVGPSETQTIQTIQAVNVPIVLVDNYVSGLTQKVDSVLSDNYEGAKQATRYLIQQGYRRIAYINEHSTRDFPGNMIHSFTWRQKGYQDALLEAGLPLDDQIIYHSYQDTLAVCKNLMQQMDPPRALFCANDPVASRIIKTLRAMDFHAPQDFSIVGFDDVDLAEHLTPPLTTMRVHKEVMGAVAVQTLIARVSNPEAIHMNHILDVQLIVRDSVLPQTR
ncbi:LacI family DNA-binding transcriptional regulator [Dictyobacter aurantiacus]|uniref:LacI family transcriptional regulator n=1 Tax=Dictyobacter aurantiacus TaxID=1936993 RepID=A0A401ZQ81_9CHLR|nr:LacI family DNA-binding transcriptional regulator [Dictyobacter aurantiacus]GCE09025.1 LacI family transcriptional regulator [Dictyobacter aurantiacus]